MRKQTNVKSIQDNFETNALRRNVLIEKHNKKVSDSIYIYTLPFPNKKSNNPLGNVCKQIVDGFAIAEKYGLNHIEYSELWNQNFEEIHIGKIQYSLLKLVILGKVKHIYVNRISYLARSKATRDLILTIYAINGVRLYDQNGVVPLDNHRASKKVMNDLGACVLLIDEVVEKPYECSRT